MFEDLINWNALLKVSCLLRSKFLRVREVCAVYVWHIRPVLGLAGHVLFSALVMNGRKEKRGKGGKEIKE